MRARTGELTSVGGTDAAAADDELVLAARAGDEGAFEELLLRHESAVLRILRLLGVPRQDREDVAQEVFVRIFRYLRGYRPGGSFDGWVYRISVNAAHDFRQRRQRRRSDEAAFRAEVVAREGDEAGRVAPEQETLRRRLESALELLSDRERAVFVLRELEGVPTEQVARALGITRITVRRHAGQARRRLERALEALSRHSQKKIPPR